MEVFREQELNTSEYHRSLVSEIDGLREVSLELIEALRVMCSSFPAPPEIKELIDRFDYLRKEK